ncbi:MAG: TetR/AcrR family transcriptional regulator [Bacteriovorax sp.]|nr:TetR/AcrR family transcriptional regulator [Bacteriovorax sp.]
MSKILKKTKTSYRHGNLREAILTTSLQVIEEVGVAGLSIREVAKKAGVTHQAPYRHFSDKEALLAALAQDGFEKMHQQISQSMAKEIKPFEKLLKLGLGYFSWASEHPDHFRLMFSQNIPEFETSESLKIAADKILELVLSVVRENQEAKIIKIDETRSVARQLWAAIHGATLLFIDRQFKPLGNNIKSGQMLVTNIITNLVSGFNC